MKIRQLNIRKEKGSFQLLFFVGIKEENMRKLNDAYLNTKLIQVITLICMALTEPFGRAFYVFVALAIVAHLAGMFLEMSMAYYERNCLSYIEKAERAAQVRLEEKEAA